MPDREPVDGNATQVASVQAELTIQEAADMLNVSRPRLLKLLEGGSLPFRQTGTQRRIRFVDLMAFKDRRDRDSDAALDELAQQAQNLGMGYE